MEHDTHSMETTPAPAPTPFTQEDQMVPTQETALVPAATQQEESHPFGRRRFLQGIGYGSLALGGAGLLGVWENQPTAHAATLTTTPWTAAPVLLRVTDAVKPGDLLTIYGEGLTSSSNHLLIAVAPVDGPQIPAQPLRNARQLSVLIGDPDGHFVSTVLPTTSRPGTHFVWVRNDHGWSRPILLNGARPQWISEDTVFAGLTLKLVGRNLDEREFRGQHARDDQDPAVATRTRVRLVSGSRHYETQVKSVNPFAVEFSISRGIPKGTYDVWASNDGLHWAKIAYADEYHQQLTVVDPAPDPLGLGVAWTNQFHWERRVSVLDYGAKPNDPGDNTAAIQNALNAVGAQGGGVVFVPAGNYRITGLTLPAGVVLEGESKEKTSLTYANTAANAATKVAISAQTDANGAAVGKIGLARLTVTLDAGNPDQVFPDIFISTGDAWGARVQDKQLRTAEYLFLKEVKLDYPLEKRTGRGIGTTLIAKGHVLVQDTDMRGYNAVVISTYISKYIHLLANHFESSTGIVVAVGIFATFEHNHISMHPELKLGDTHGIFTRGPSYLAENSVENVGTVGFNDGETYNTENFRGGSKMIGTVSTATATTVTVNPKWVTLSSVEDHTWNPWDITHHCWAGWHIVITDGRGLGQDRLLVSWDGNQTYTLAKPWDVLPDSSSKFVVLVPIKGTTFYHNTATNAAKGCFFYNDTLDGVVVRNSGQNTEGCYINSFYIERPAQKDFRFTIGYFDRIEDNTADGVSPMSNVVGMGARVALETGDAYAYNLYGLSLKHNSITAVLPAPNPTGTSEAPDVNGLYLVNRNVVQTATRNAILAAGIEDNTVTNSDRGISLGGTGYPLDSPQIKAFSNPVSYGVVLKQNTFTNVTQQVVDNGTTGTVHYP